MSDVGHAWAQVRKGLKRASHGRRLQPQVGGWRARGLRPRSRPRPASRRRPLDPGTGAAPPRRPRGAPWPRETPPPPAAPAIRGSKEAEERLLAPVPQPIECQSRTSRAPGGRKGHSGGVQVPHQSGASPSQELPVHGEPHCAAVRVHVQDSRQDLARAEAGSGALPVRGAQARFEGGGKAQSIDRAAPEKPGIAGALRCIARKLLKTPTAGVIEGMEERGSAHPLARAELGVPVRGRQNLWQVKPIHLQPRIRVKGRCSGSIEPQSWPAGRHDTGEKNKDHAGLPTQLPAQQLCVCARAFITNPVRTKCNSFLLHLSTGGFLTDPVRTERKDTRRPSGSATATRAVTRRPGTRLEMASPSYSGTVALASRPASVDSATVLRALSALVTTACRSWPLRSFVPAQDTQPQSGKAPQ